jgi:electron transfer flavoprotein alpha subunit
VGGSVHGALLTSESCLPQLAPDTGIEVIWNVSHPELRLHSRESALAALRAIWNRSGADLFLAAATPDGQEMVLAIGLEEDLPCATCAIGFGLNKDQLAVRQALPSGQSIRVIEMDRSRGCVAVSPNILEQGTTSLPRLACDAMVDGGDASPFSAGFPVRSYLVPPVSTVSPEEVRGGGRVVSAPMGTLAPPEVVKVDLEIQSPIWPTLGVEAADSETVDVSEAELVVAGGLGFHTRGRFDHIWDLAGALKAAVGVTRPVVDAGWASFERQIGQTGRNLHARAYLGLGISGATHHTAGIADCGLVIAVNTDPNAPIFRVADVGFVADAHDVVRELVEEISRRKSSTARTTEAPRRH